MNKANNQVYQETEKRLREALLYYMEAEREPTVGQLCAMSKINRSTFYRHYMDIEDLMEKTELDLQQGLVHIFAREEGSSFGILDQLIDYIGTYQGFYRVYLRKTRDSFFETGFQNMWEERLRSRFEAAGVLDERRMHYYYQFVRAGVTQVLRLWVEGGCRESSQEISSILRAMLSANRGNEKMPLA